MKRLNLIGKKFSKLEVIEFSHVENGNSYWKCLCDCNNIRILSACHLKNGNTTSCGCSKTYRYAPGESGLRCSYSAYKSRAKEFKRIFDLTLKEFEEITSKNCFYCGIKPNNVSLTKASEDDRRTKYRSYTYNGIDRIDSSMGYVKGNVVPCCKWCNIAKSNKSVEEFKGHIRKMYHHFLKEPEHAFPSPV
jgi:hypothetical protein